MAWVIGASPMNPIRSLDISCEQLLLVGQNGRSSRGARTTLTGIGQTVAGFQASTFKGALGSESCLIVNTWYSAKVVGLVFSEPGR